MPHMQEGAERFGQLARLFRLVSIHEPHTRLVHKPLRQPLQQHMQTCQG